jgi:phage gpG-like protein
VSFAVRIIRDEVSPGLAKLDAALHRLGPVLKQVGLEIVDLTQRAFVDPSLRVAPWSPKRDGSPATLIQSGFLRQSIRITSIGETTVAVGTDRIYAAIQQLGGTIKAKDGGRLRFTSGGVTYFVRQVTIPPRPFLPITAGGELSSVAQRKVGAVLQKALTAYLP